MLPQMMPLPWLVIYFMVFFCFFTFYLFFSYTNYVSYNVSSPSFKSKGTSLPW